MNTTTLTDNTDTDQQLETYGLSFHEASQIVTACEENDVDYNDIMERIAETFDFKNGYNVEICVHVAENIQVLELAERLECSLRTAKELERLTSDIKSVYKIGSRVDLLNHMYELYEISEAVQQFIDDDRLEQRALQNNYEKIECRGNYSTRYVYVQYDN